MRDKAKGQAALRRAYQDRLAVLRARLFAIPTGNDCRRVVIPEADVSEPCKVVSRGTVANTPGPRLEFLVQAYGKAKDDPRAVAQIVFAPDVKGPGSVVAVLSEGMSYDPPAIVQTSGATLLHVLGRSGGTGDFPARALFVWRDQTWHRVNTSAWIADLKKRLPRGLNVDHGIYPDFAAMTAKTDLWRSDDPNCCPSGGTVAVRLRLDGDRIVLDHFEIARAARQ